jgi:anti-sigma factor RsiW
MSCEVDLKEYFLGETPRDDRRRVESHITDCHSCREELSRLQLTQAALGALRDEEMPRRIAFVSDKVFEPRWYQRLWRSGPQLGFLAASLLTGAILVHAFTRPPAIVQTVAPVDQAAIERTVNERVSEAVTKAVAQSEMRQQKKTVELLQAAEKRHDLYRRGLEMLAGQVAFIQRKANNDYMASAGLRSDGQ